jgi:glycosyltransferase involved in cell wall biosynthesis
MPKPTVPDPAPRPRVSIIVATWNAAHTLDRCIDSIVAQDFTDWELLVSDGGSTDGTVRVLRERSDRIAWWRSEADHGIYDAWNRALEHAGGDYVCFLGADDAWIDSEALGRLVASASEGEPDLITSVGVGFDPASGKQVRIGGAWDYERIGRRMIVCHPGLLHRRALFDRYGTFNVRYRITGDLDFLLRLPADLRTVHVDVPTVAVEVGGVSRRNVLARLREQRDVLRRCKRYGPLRANLVWIDKLWRYPIARLLGLPY